MDRIGPNARVVLDYTLKADGEIVDASDGSFPDSAREPIVYIHGYGMIVPGLERALAGLVAGDTKDVVVTPEEGYGDRDEELVVEVDRAEMPRPDAVAVGDEIVAESPEGDEASLTVVDIDGDTVVLDGNHPLAGKTLHYSVIVRHVGPATDVEIAEAARAFEEARAAMEPEPAPELVQLRRSPKSLPN
ncbi:MAG: peptidylprolyl isomerase [Labilithrix sp.]